MKTCILVPGLVSKAKLLFERHSRTIENDFEGATSVDEFVRLHNEIDWDIKWQNTLYRRVSIAFVAVDFALYLIFFGSFTSLQYEVIFHRGTLEAQKILKLLLPVLDVIVALILAFCALYLAKSLKKTTGSKPNVCLLFWHIVNIFLLTVMLVLYDIYYDKWIKSSGTDFFKAWYQMLVV